MHKDIVLAIPFFQNKPPAFVASIGNLLKPIKVSKDDYIFMEGDPADESLRFIKLIINLKQKCILLNQEKSLLSCQNIKISNS